MNENELWHSYAREKVLIMLRADAQKGLATSEATKRLEQNGPNELQKERKMRFVQKLYKHLKSPLSIVLLLAGVATLVLQEFLDAIVIACAVFINVAVSMYQEGRAAQVFETLAHAQEKHATVLRDGVQKVILARELVVGDIVMLQGGSAVPADMRLLSTSDLHCNEASLTGEWIPVEKIATTLGRALPLGDQRNMVWMGTLVTQGSGHGVVVATGARARVGQLATSTQAIADTNTPLQKSINHLARFLMWLVAGAVVVIICIGLLRGQPFMEMLLLGIAVAVAAMPEGLPAAVTVVLALGMEAILRKGGLVKNLLAAETLGSTTVVLTDKTGTLTKGQMTLKGVYTARSSESGDPTAEGDARDLLRMAVLSSDAFIEDESDAQGEAVIQGRPIEKAIVAGGIEEGLAQNELEQGGYARLDFTQFEPSRRYAISLNENKDGRNRAYLSGSPEHILARSNHFYQNGREVRLTDEVRAHFVDIQKRISAEGMRFTAVAYVTTQEACVPDTLKDAAKNEHNAVFVGLLAFADAVRDDVPEAIAITKRAGARVLMATGDYPETARAIAYEVGIDTRTDAPVLTGAHMADMSDEQLLEALTTHNIIARVIPEQKLRVARLLRNAGEVVAMTGDGVNDAPALIAADIGIAVGSGTDVAKAAADIVLVDNSFSVITAAIAEGRRVIANLRKIITYLLSTSFSEIVVIGGALAFGAPLPLLPTQILWANIVGEGFMSFPFAFEPHEKGSMERKPEKPKEVGILTSHVRWLIFIVSTITGLALLALYYVLLKLETPIEEIRTMLFVALSIGSMFFAFSLKDFTQPIWKISIFSNVYLLGALAASFALLMVALVFPPLQTLLSLTPLTGAEVGILVALGLLNVATIEGAKMALRKRLVVEM